MESVKNYILSLTGFSFISSLACALLPEIPAKRTVKFVCGVVLCLLILAPVKNMKLEFSDIFEETETYNLDIKGNSADELTKSVLADKVSEVVGNCFEKYGFAGAQAEMIFDGEGNILSVNINKVCVQAAEEAAEALGLPVEIIHMTE